MDNQPLLFDELPEQLAPPAFRQSAQGPVWTESKAKLVSRYLRLFTFITRHGVYIDGFAAPKAPDVPDTWAAKLVIENEPKWLREFILCEMKPRKAAHLKALVDEQPPEPKRLFDVRVGDFNHEVDGILASGIVTDRKATFCLLDQYTCQCHWSSVEKLARHKQGRAKIELFYFLATGWLQRALLSFRDTEIPERWWGRSDWRSLIGLSHYSAALEFKRRFETELGYRYVYPWPIFQRHGTSGRVMFYMIHASDHREAPVLMNRAYNSVLQPPEPVEQMELLLPKRLQLDETA